MRPPWAWGRSPLTLPEQFGGADLASPPCIVHLVRAANGPRSLREFAEALRRHDPGIEHELVLAMKGFRSRAEAAPYLEQVADLAPTVLFFPDVGFDTGVFLATAARLRRARYCFMNSHIRPVDDGWLAKLDAALDRPRVGAVGPFGSWASFHSWLTYSMGLPSAYRGVLPPPQVARRLLLEIDFEQQGIERRTVLGRLRTRLALLAQAPEELLDFEPFPAHHLRTSSFMIPHAILRELRLFTVRRKIDAYALESGSQNITCQVEQLGLRALVVDSTGAVYEREEWDRSGTLWQGEQERLLIADNRTLSYERGDLARRRLLSGLAWGAPTDSHPSGLASGALTDSHSSGLAWDTPADSDPSGPARGAPTDSHPSSR